MNTKEVIASCTDCKYLSWYWLLGQDKKYTCKKYNKKIYKTITPTQLMPLQECKDNGSYEKKGGD